MTMAPLLDVVADPPLGFVVGPPLDADPVLVLLGGPVLDAPEALRFDSPAVIRTVW